MNFTESQFKKFDESQLAYFTDLYKKNFLAYYIYNDIPLGWNHITGKNGISYYIECNVSAQKIHDKLYKYTVTNISEEYPDFYNVMYYFPYSEEDSWIPFWEMNSKSSHRYHKVPKTGTIIDLGCTEGLFAVLNASRLCNVIGVDGDITWKESFENTLKDNGFKNFIFMDTFVDENFNLPDTFDDCPVVSIKMDIEGWEQKALYALTPLIKKYKPQLQICVYHKPDDRRIIEDYCIECLGYTNFTYNPGFICVDFWDNDTESLYPPIYRKAVIIANY